MAATTVQYVYLVGEDIWVNAPANGGAGLALVTRVCEAHASFAAADMAAFARCQGDVTQPGQFRDNILASPGPDDDTIICYESRDDAFYKSYVTQMPLIGGIVALTGSVDGNEDSMQVMPTAPSLTIPRDDEVQEEGAPPAVTPAVIASRAGGKRKATMTHEADEDEEQPSPPTQAATQDHVSSGDRMQPMSALAANPFVQFAPGGYSGCLGGLTFWVTGTLERWTREQAHALIEAFDGITEDYLKRDIDYAVVGAKPAAVKLADMDKRFPHIKRISQDELYDLIKTRPGSGTDPEAWLYKEDVTEICMGAKNVRKPRAKKFRPNAAT